MDTAILGKNMCKEDSVGLHTPRDVNNDKEHPEIAAQISFMEAKFQDFMKRTDSKFDSWMTQALNKVQAVDADAVDQSKSRPVEPKECTNCEALRSRYDAALKLNIEKEKETMGLKEELLHKTRVIQDLTKEIRSLSDELSAKNHRISALTWNKQPGYEAKIVQLEITTSKQNLQLAALQEQNNILAAENEFKDKLVTTKQNELKALTEQVKKHEVQRAIPKDSFSLLRSRIRRNTITITDLSVIKENTCDSDVIIIHDLLERGFNFGLMQNKKIVVKEIWATRLRDALSYVKSMKVTPKLVLLHTGTNDLPNMTDIQMVKFIVEIYQLLNKRDIKFIWSNIVPRCDDFELNMKGYFVNVKVGKELANKNAAYIARNEDFYLRDMLHPSILDALNAQQNTI